MESPELIATGTCQQNESLASTDYHWEEVNRTIPDSSQTNKCATFPNSHLHNECRRISQHELSGDNRAPTYRICPACRYETTTLDVHLPIPPADTMAVHRYYSDEPLHLPSYDSSVNGDSQHVPRAVSNSSQLNLPIPVMQTPTTPLDADSRTISIHSSNSERVGRLYTAVQAVHDICLRSTKIWLDSHLVNCQARAGDSLLPHKAYADNLYSRTHSQAGSNGDQNAANINDSSSNHYRNLIPPSTNSLLKNTSSICSMLWAHSQRDRVYVLDIERNAIDTMSHLLCWAETVALGDYDEWKKADGEPLRHVLQAGMNMCYWLGFADGIKDMEALKSDVMAGGYGCH